MKKKYVDCIAGAVLMLFSIWGWYETSTWKESAASSGISVKAYPRAVFALIFVCGAIILIGTIIKNCRDKNQNSSDGNKIIEMHPIKVIVTVLLMVAYILALREIGFLYSTPVFLIATMFFFGERNWPRIIAISIVGTLVLYLFFVKIMHVNF